MRVEVYRLVREWRVHWESLPEDDECLEPMTMLLFLLAAHAVFAL